MTEIVAIGACTVITLVFVFIVWDLVRRDSKKDLKKPIKPAVTDAQKVSNDWNKVSDTWNSVGN